MPSCSNPPAQVYSGDTWTRSWVRIDAKTKKPIPANNISNARLQVKINPTDDTYLWQATLGNGISIPNPSDGTIRLAKLMTIPAGNYVYDLEIVFSDGTVKTFEQNTLIVVQDVTR